MPSQPAWKPAAKPNTTNNAEAWKASYFAKHPEADANQDGKLTWPELKAFRTKIGDGR